MNRVADGKELKEGCSKTENHKSLTVTMETTEQSALPMDCEVEAAEADSLEQGMDFGADDEKVSEETGLADTQGNRAMVGALLTQLDKNVCPDMPGQEEKNALTLKSEHEELNRNKSTTSVSDTLSHSDSVNVNEACCKMLNSDERDPEQEPETDQYTEPEPSPEPQQCTELESAKNPEFQFFSESEQDTEPAIHPDNDHDFHLEFYTEPKQERELELYPEPDQDSELELYTQPDQDPDLGLYAQLEQDPDPELYPEPDHGPDLDLYPQLNQDPNLELYAEPDQDSNFGFYSEPVQDADLQLHMEPDLAVDDEFDPQLDDDKDLPNETQKNPQSHSIEFEVHVREESPTEQSIREEAMSELSNESSHDLDEMDECQRVETGTASSDGEADEKWRTIFSSSINKEDDDSYLDSLQLSAQELFVQKVIEEQNYNEEEVSFDIPQVEEVLEQPDNIISFTVPTHEVKYNPLGLQGLSKISEDEGENGRDVNYNHSTHQEHINTDQNKKLPKDFCVIQETKSENVSTEHVDFQLARKQWRKMEEQTRNTAILLPTKQPSIHGNHNFMYTPVRNIERAHKKAHELESLNLVEDYAHTQFSPCSEDSGLGDSSYRSPHDYPETPFEREIRISMEREENLRRDRGLPRMGKSTDCAPSRGIPRSISTPLTPSFIITSSPTKEPLQQEESANNVVILDPSKDFTSSPRLGAGEWRSEDHSSNLIILETSNLIIRSASDYSLNKSHDQPQEKMFLNNPFFKLRSRSTISLVDEEIKLVQKRDEELRKERANLYSPNRFNTERMLSQHMDTLTFDISGKVPEKCKSSPSSPMKTAHRMDRSALSCDQRFPEAYTGVRRKSAMALRWEAGEFIKHD